MNKYYTTYSKNEISTFNSELSPLDVDVLLDGNGYYYIKITFNGVLNKEYINKCLFQFKLLGQNAYREYEIYITDYKDLSESTRDSFVDKLKKSLTPNYIVYDKEEFDAYGNNLGYMVFEQELLNEPFLISEENPTLVLVMIPNSALDDSATKIFNFSAFGQNTDDITSASKLDNYQYDDSVEVMVNEYNGSVTTLVNLFSTLNKNSPINLVIIDNKTTLIDSNLPYKLLIDSKYLLKIEYIKEKQDDVEVNKINAFIIKDAYGCINRFFIINESNKTQYDKYFVHNIEGSKFYSKETGACLYYKTADRRIYIYDKNQNQIGLFFDYFNNLAIDSKCYKGGKAIVYNRNDYQLLTSLSINEEENVTFSYSDNYLSCIDYHKRKVKVDIRYLENQVLLDYIKYDSSTILLKTITLHFDNEILTKITNSLNDDKLLLTYSNNKIQNIKMKRNNNILYSNTYEYMGQNRKLTDLYGDFLCTIFDEYGRCKYETNKYGKYTAYEYIGYTNLLKNKFENVYVRKLLENNSFEKLDENNKPYNWETTSNGLSTFKLVDGIYGKCLAIDLAYSDTVTLSKRIYDELGKLNSIKGYIKHSAPSYQNVTISVNGKYKANGYESTINQTINTIKNNKDWQEFTFKNLGVPSNANYVDVTLTIQVKTYQCTVMIDEISFNDDDLTLNNVNLINNGNMNVITNNIPDYWNFTNRSVNELVNNVDDYSYESMLGHNVMRLIGNNEERKMYQILPIEGEENDAYYFSLFYKLFSKKEKLTPYIKFYLDSDYEYDETYELDSDSTINEWNIAHKFVNPTSKYYAIEIGVKYKGENTIYVDNFQLFKIDQEHYNYDNRNNIIGIYNDGANIECIYDEYNRIKSIITSEGLRYSYNYLSNDKLHFIEDNRGNKVTYSYDSNGFLTYKEFTHENELISKNMVNDSEGYIIYDINEFNNKIIYQYDLQKNITKQIYPNGLALSATYTNNNQLSILGTTLSSVLHKNKISYTNIEKVESIISPNGVNYTFGYDNYGNLTNIKINNVVICTFEYGKIINGYNTFLMTSKFYSETCKYNFNYDSKQRLKNISYNSNVFVEFEYDVNDNISKVVNKINNITKYITYDSKNRIKQIIMSDFTKYNYYYDNRGSIKKINYYLDNNYKSYDFITKTTHTFNSYIQKYKKMFNDEIIIGGNDFKGINGLTPLENKLSSDNYLVENNLPIYSFKNDNEHVYFDTATANSKINKEYYNGKIFKYDIWQNTIKNKRIITLWFKPKEKYSSTNLLMIDKKNIFLNLNEEGCLEVKILFSGSVVSTKKVNLNQWNMVTMSMIDNSINVILNGEKVIEYETSTSKLGDLHINYYLSPSDKALETPFDICFLSLGTEEIELSMLKKLYNDGAKFLNNIIEGELHNLQYLKASSTYEIFTLNNSLVSNKGTEPIFVSRPLEDELFEFDSSINNSVLALYQDEDSLFYGGTTVKYDLKLDSLGMISLKFKIKNFTNEIDNKIMSLKDKEDNEILRFYVKNNLINIVVNGVSQTYYIKTILKNTWYTLTIFYDTSNINFYIDKDKVGTFTSSNPIILNNSYLYLDKSLNGVMEKLIVYKGYINTSNHANYAKNLYNNKYLVNHIDYYDTFNRLTKREIKTSSTKTLDFYYNYNKTRIEEESLLDEYIKYVYNNMGCVTQILKKNSLSSEYSINKEYTYDSFGRIKVTVDYEKGIVTNYEYNKNGSIVKKDTKNLSGTTIGSKRFTYYESNPDLLISMTNGEYNINHIEYGDNNCPTSIVKNGENIELVFEGKNLIRYGNNIYTYDENNNRIGKETENGWMYLYKLENNKILSETIIDELGLLKTKFYYNYDKNGNLISIEENGITYFYIKDILGTIHKIVDEDGNVIVKYSYDEWGVVTKEIVCLPTDVGYNVATYNSFLYKSYYYDVETQLFYCNSRYYSPELCRWISPDSIEYLDPSSINGLNLYCYCMNNPIMYSDPSGHFAITSFLIGLGISALIGAVAGGVSYAASELVSYAFTGEFSWSWASFAGSVLGGAIGGALAAIPGVNAMVVAGVSGFASTAIGMGLENAWEGKDYTFGQIMFASTINGLISSAAGGLFEAIPIKGLTSGRGSYSAITKQITTKFFNGTIKRITYNTFSKMLTYNMLGGMIGAGVSGVMDATGANDWMANWFHQRTGF